MNELYKNKLENLVEDDLMIKVIKEVFNQRIEQERPTIGDAESNSLLGEKYRAYVEAKRILSQAFLDIGSYKLENKSTKKFNKER